MVPIPGGKFVMGSPDGEPGAQPDEGPQHEVEISPFWMGGCEVTWNEYEIWAFSLDIQRRKVNQADATDLDKMADAVTRPTKPYTDMRFGMGKEGYPAISHDAVGRQDLLQMAERRRRAATIACRPRPNGNTPAGPAPRRPTVFGDDPARLGDYAWYYRQQQRHISQGRQEEAQSLGAVRHARQRLPNGRSTNTLPTSIKQFAGKTVEESAGDSHEGVSAGGPRRLVGRRRRQAAQRRPAAARTRIGRNRTRKFRRASGI